MGITAAHIAKPGSHTRATRVWPRSFALRAACIVILAFTIVLILPGCGDDTSTGEAQAAPATKGTSSGASSKATGASFKLPKSIRIPQVSSTDSSLIDTAGVNEGYVSAAAVSPSRLKFQVKCGDMVYNYDMPSDGSAMLFPINMGNGSYVFRIMENIEGSNYAELDASSADIQLSSEFEPFLIPNIFCNYNAKSSCVKKAYELAKSDKNQGEVVRDICSFVAENVSYDYDKAEYLAKSSGYIPNPDSTLSEKKGVCFDYAALSAAMLRSLGLPAKVITGFVSPGDLYHSWIMVYVDGTWQTALFSVTPNTWSRCDVTFASAGESAVTGNGTSYTDKYAY